MRWRSTLISLAAIGFVTGCGGTSDSEALTVFAAASLTGPVTELAAAFESANPEVDVVLSFAASSELATQIVEGAPADVFASADTANMDKVSAARDGEPVIFASNRLQIITEAGNPLGITGLDDLADPRILFVTCAPEVPIGAYTAEVFARAGVNVSPVSFEENVKSIVAKVTTGEADAGIVYTTDVIAAGASASGVDIADEFNVVASYPIARVSTSDIATRFIDFVVSASGRAILDGFGFGSP